MHAGRALELELPSDEDLLFAICAGDVDALGALYDRHAAHALALAFRIVADRQVAEEVVQDAFLSVWRQAATYSAGRGRARPWLLAIVHHRAIDRLRRVRDRQPHAALDDAWMLASETDVFADVYGSLRRTSIRRALAALPVDQRDAIDLLYFGGYSFREAADMIGVPAGTVKSRVRLGLAKLKALLDEELL
jgi:RNA polymerase sigma-70 factor, ECF subfamily